MKANIGVFFGGRSVEHEISVISALQAIQAIDHSRYDVTPIYISKAGQWYTGEQLLDVENYRKLDELLNNSTKIIMSPNFEDYSFVESGAKGLFKKPLKGKIDIAFPVLHGSFGEDGALQGLFELMGIPYIGCDVLSSAVGMDKIMMKMVLKESGLPVVKYVWFYSKNWQQDTTSHIGKVEQTLGYPVIVKPANLGSSVGIKKAANREELEEAIDYAAGFSHKLLVEQTIVDLKEINCSVLGNYENAQASTCEEPLMSGEILSYQDKYVTKGGNKGMSGTKRKLPAEIPTEMSDKIQQLAVDTFQVLGCAGVSRIDFLLDQATNEVYVNEINTIPGSLSFYLWEATDKNFGQLVNDLIDTAFKNYREKNNLTFSYEETNIFSMSGKGGGMKLSKS
ncbi:D-alanine--D-alanine ligase family protein [Microscilla marina]|uniref:D-alanine--D-alanine ligase n=1 Tax=Microscilla marina ATCC 23134 TaxID=313606 RepID=A1ZZ06_MICM2|nr:D-alanine--D-alanine ligase family protein [Microscilla marina]EAY24386.1 D-alanine--D-alanine ligase [Microscilla marina ATCC 23134]